MNDVRADGRLTCYRLGCTRVIPKKAKIPYTCKCGRRHLFLPMWDCCGKYMDRETRKGDKCPHCCPTNETVECAYCYKTSPLKGRLQPDLMWCSRECKEAWEERKAAEKQPSPIHELYWGIARRE